MAIIVFDLDMTLIDSSHRHASNPDGSVDLAHWFENATPEKIASDTMLPLASRVARLHDAGHKIVFCTSRLMQDADYDWLNNHRDVMPFHWLFSRPKGDMRSDGIIKMEQITDLIEMLGYKNFEDANVILFEDNLKTIEMFRREHAICYDATRINKKMAA